MNVTFPSTWQQEQDMSPLTQLDSLPRLRPLQKDKNPDFVPVMSMRTWSAAIQEVQNLDAKRTTQCSMFPGIWKNVAVTCQVFWKKERWAYFEKKNPNLSDLKSRLTKWIVIQRKLTLFSDIISEYQDHTFAAALPEKYCGSPVYYLSYAQFVQWATETFKVDQTEISEISR